MQTAGIDSGMTKTTSIASGHSGQWSETSANFNNITSAGQLAFRVGFNSALYSVYLRRDGTLPMTGDLNLDGHNINNVDALNATGNITTTGDLQARNIKATGKIDAGGNISAGNWVYAKNGYGDVIGMGGDAIGDDYEINLQSPKRLTIHSPKVPVADRKSTVVFRVNGAISSGGDLTASGNITATENVKGATLESTGRATVGEFIQLNGQATVGATCSPNGLQGRSKEGSILSCVNGTWESYKNSYFDYDKCYNTEEDSPKPDYAQWGSGSNGFAVCDGRAGYAAAGFRAHHREDRTVWVTVKCCQYKQ